MLVDFFYHLRSQKLLVSVKEYLTLLEALSSPIMPPTLEDFSLPRAHHTGQRRDAIRPL